MLQIFGFIAVLVVVGLSVEFLRRGKVKTWVEQHDGAFLGSGPVPEAAQLDGENSNVSYRNIGRFERGGATYVVAERHWYRSQGIGGSSSGGTSAQVVCVISLAGRQLPAIHLGRHRPGGVGGAMVQGMQRAVGVERPAVVVPGEVLPAFGERFEVRARGAEIPEQAALDALLTPAVQEVLVAHADAFAAVDAVGDAVRISMVTQQLKRNHDQALAIAEALVAALEP